MKAMNHLRSKLPTSLQKQATVVAGLISEYGYQFWRKKHKRVTNETKCKVEKLYYRTDVVYIMPRKEDRWEIGQKRVKK